MKCEEKIRYNRMTLAKRLIRAYVRDGVMHYGYRCDDCNRLHRTKSARGNWGVADAIVFLSKAEK